MAYIIFNGYKKIAKVKIVFLFSTSSCICILEYIIKIIPVTIMNDPIAKVKLFSIVPIKIHIIPTNKLIVSPLSPEELNDPDRKEILIADNEEKDNLEGNKENNNNENNKNNNEKEQKEQNELSNEILNEIFKELDSENF